MNKKVFYLGKTPDLNGERLEYNPNNLTTHAAIVGMTGSGKTGLALCLLEEAVLNNIPVIAIDPKGDLPNLLLTFQELLSIDFIPWIDAQEAAQKGMEPHMLAVEKARLWEIGIKDWGQSKSRINQFKESADFQVYTPGSTAGVPVSILGSLELPDKKILDNPEFLTDQVKNTTKSLLALLQINAEPLKSREFILISAILKTVWRSGNNLTLLGLISGVQTPPFNRIGLLDIEAFFPEKDRFALAVRMNNLIASPGFKTWMKGIHLNAGDLLWTSDDKPRVSIFSIAHLSDSERMFFVSMLFNKIIEWMRTQAGSANLRAVIYMDEVFGYLPPVRNPPSKEPLLTLLKQARAFGLGIVLSTQNPVDLDYKGLSNMGTWMIGRLQTERDKARLLDGLEGVATIGFNRSKMDSLISGLEQRSFLMNNVHSKGPVVFQSRWALSYLSGPMTLKQIERLVTDRPKVIEQSTATGPPILHPDIDVYYKLKGIEDQDRAPVLIARVQTYYSKPAWGIDETVSIILATKIIDSIVPVKWSRSKKLSLDLDLLSRVAPGDATYSALPMAAKNPKSYKAWKNDVLRWISQTYYIQRHMSNEFKKISSFGESKPLFEKRLRKMVDKLKRPELQIVEDKYLPQFDKFLETVEALEEQLEYIKAHPPSPFMAMFGVMTVVLPYGSKLRRASLGWDRELEPAQIEKTYESLREKSQALEERFNLELTRVNQKFTLEDIEILRIYPKKTGMTLDFFGVCWV